MLKGLNVNQRANLAPDTYPTNTTLTRFVYSVGASLETFEQAQAFYTPRIRLLNQRGITPILVINQEFFGNGRAVPWLQNSPISWHAFANNFGEAVRRLAQHHVNDKVIYQIWNEGDISGISSVALTPPQYALILKASITAIRWVSPKAVVLSQGHASAAGNVVAYWRAVEAAYGGKVPVSGIAVHPYGQYMGSRAPLIATGWFGNLSEYWRIVSVLGYPLWVTEIGVSEERGFPESQYVAIAEYMRETWDYLQNQDNCSAFVWFAWHDGMRGAGIVNMSSKPKKPIFETFESLRSESKTVTKELPMLDLPPVEFHVLLRVASKVRSLPTTESDQIDLVAKDTWMRCHEAIEVVFDNVRAKQGNRNTWIAVHTRNNRVGFIRGDLVSDAQTKNA